jgi:Domain of unknown function (DUF4864)
MRNSLFALGIALTLSTPLMAQQADPDITGIIQNQLDAFQADDVTTAFSFASPTIQGIFGTAQNFGAMVQQGYPMVWRPAAVKYLDLRQGPDGMYQKVAITDQAGALHVLEYQMIPDGSGWVIGGVQVLQQPEVGA